MAAGATVRSPDPAPIAGCTVSRGVSAYDGLVAAMDSELGAGWGDLPFEEAEAYLDEPEAAGLEFLAVVVEPGDAGPAAGISPIDALIAAAGRKGVGVILIAGDVDAGALHRLMRLGADDFLPLPLPDGALAEALARLRAPAPTAPALQSVPAATETAGGRAGAVLAVQGVAGGVGATTLAVNLAWELAARKGADAPRVCLLDFDFQFGAVATYLDLAPRDAVYELLSDIAAMDGDAFGEALLRYGDALSVLTAPKDLLPLDFLGPDEIAKLVAVARDRFDFVVIDLPKTLVQWTETVLTETDLCLAPLEMDLRSAQNTLRLIRALKAEDLPHEKLRYTLNRAPGRRDMAGRGRARRLAEGLGIEIGLSLPDGGRGVREACDHGTPLALTAKRNPLRREIRALAGSLAARAMRAATEG